MGDHFRGHIRDQFCFYIFLRYFFYFELVLCLLVTTIIVQF